MTTVGFYVKAGVETGYGHIVRCLAMADELRERGCECIFFTNDEGKEKASAQEFDTFNLRTFFMCDFSTTQNIWIVDLEGGCPPILASYLSEYCHVLVILNGVGYPDGDPGRLLADLVFYQGVTRRPYELDWTGFEGEWLEGSDWLILRREFSQVKAKPGSHDPPRIVVAGGGSDPKNVTGKVLDALKDDPLEVHAIVGPANQNGLGYDPRKVELLYSPDNMAEALAWADVAVVSYGMTAFECLALGLPTVALSISEDHALSANRVQQGCGAALTSLGPVECVSAQTIRAMVYAMLTRPAQLSKFAHRFVDGKGAGRVADKIMEVLSEKLGMGQ
jgi:spore coat polysaccharide biosynthesis protein SpsF